MLVPPCAGVRLLYKYVFMRKIIFSLLLMALLPSMSIAQEAVSRVFISMPDSILPYLDASQRQELADDIAQKEKPIVVNSLGDTTRIDNISTDYMKLYCNKAHTIEMKILPRVQEKDSIICLVNTYNGPAEESDITFFDMAWQKLNQNLTPSVKPQQLLAKPDTLSDEDYSSLAELLDPTLIKINLSPKSRTVTYQLSIPAVPNDKKKQLEGLLSQMNFNWDGERFN